MVRLAVTEAMRSVTADPAGGELTQVRPPLSSWTRNGSVVDELTSIVHTCRRDRNQDVQHCIFGATRHSQQPSSDKKQSHLLKHEAIRQSESLISIISDEAAREEWAGAAR